jgi:hypothetical protein
VLGWGLVSVTTLRAGPVVLVVGSVLGWGSVSVTTLRTGAVGTLVGSVLGWGSVSVTTLRAGPAVTLVGSVLGWGSGCARPVRRRVSWWSVATWLSVRGARGEFADGFCRAVVMSWMPAMMRSVDEARGMVTLVGNHDTVSEMRSVREANIQMV